jgi:hypothetical protein
MNQTNSQNGGIERGDRVEVQLHGARRPNDAKGTVVDESPVSVIPSVVVRLDGDYNGCENPYEAPRSSVSKIADRWEGQR